MNCALSFTRNIHSMVVIPETMRQVPVRDRLGATKDVTLAEYVMMYRCMAAVLNYCKQLHELRVEGSRVSIMFDKSRMYRVEHVCPPKLPDGQYLSGRQVRTLDDQLLDACRLQLHNGQPYEVDLWFTYSLDIATVHFFLTTPKDTHNA